MNFSEINIEFLYFMGPYKTDIGYKVYPKYRKQPVVFTSGVVSSPFTVFEERDKYCLLLQLEKNDDFHRFLSDLDHCVIEKAMDSDWLPHARKFSFIYSATDTDIGPLLKTRVAHRYNNFELLVKDPDGRLLAIDEITPKCRLQAVLELKYYWIIDDKIGPLWNVKEIHIVNQ